MVSPLQGCCDRCGLPPLEAWVQPMLASPCVQDLRNEPSIPSNSSAFKPCCCPLWVSPLSKVVSLRSYCSQPHSPVRRISSAPKRRTYAFHPSVQTSKRSHGLTTGANSLEQTICQFSISMDAHHSCQPYSDVVTSIARPIQAIILHPFTRISSACTCIGSTLPLFDDGLMHLVAMLSCSLLPIRYGAFIQPIGMHNRLDWGIHTSRA